MLYVPPSPSGNGTISLSPETDPDDFSDVVSDCHDQTGFCHHLHRLQMCVWLLHSGGRILGFLAAGTVCLTFQKCAADARS